MLSRKDLNQSCSTEPRKKFKIKAQIQSPCDSHLQDPLKSMAVQTPQT